MRHIGSRYHGVAGGLERDTQIPGPAHQRRVRWQRRIGIGTGEVNRPPVTGGDVAISIQRRDREAGRRAGGDGGGKAAHQQHARCRGIDTGRGLAGDRSSHGVRGRE